VLATHDPGSDLGVKDRSVLDRLQGFYRSFRSAAAALFDADPVYPARQQEVVHRCVLDERNPERRDRRFALPYTASRTFPMHMTVARAELRRGRGRLAGGSRLGGLQRGLYDEPTASPSGVKPRLPRRTAVYAVRPGASLGGGGISGESPTLLPLAARPFSSPRCADCARLPPVVRAALGGLTTHLRDG